MNINSKNECFITLKDHKPNFENKLPTRLINPAKNEIGRISKAIVQKANANLRTTLQLQQWNNTNDVLNWFKNIRNKKLCKFMMFDIKEFYPSITEKLLKDAISFAKKHVPISNNDMKIIKHARKSLLYSNGKPWVKKNNESFDVTMGAFDGAEICELVGCYLLSTISKSYQKENVGLYRDDGLAVFENISGPEADRIRKHFHAMFKKNGLDLEIECNLTIVNYLDVTLNLENGTYKPYRKPNDETIYIHAKSNHPPNITKQLPLSIERRLNKLSSTEKIFNESAKHYQEALNRSGYQHTLQFNQIDTETPQQTRSRKRNIIWFNPPFSKSISTNIGSFFLKLVNKHFPKNHKYRKIFNRNTLKISYSCMPSVKSAINVHNRRILQENTEELRTCNCIKKETCPLSNQCLTTNIIYEATITSNSHNSRPKIYIGLSEGPFKRRYANHKKSFKYAKYEKETELSKEYWRLKNKNETPIVTWKIKKKCTPFNQNSGICNLCLSEKKIILEQCENPNVLNRRDELVSKCRHENKFKLNSLNDVKN